VAILDLIFIFFVVPESLPERLRSDQKISWDKIDPFAVNFLFYNLCKIMIWVIFRLYEILHMIVLFVLFVLLFYYPISPVRKHFKKMNESFLFIEAGQYSCFFVYLRLVRFYLSIEISKNEYLYFYSCSVFPKMKSLISLLLSEFSRVLLK